MSVYSQLLRILQEELYYQEKLLLLLSKEQTAVVKLRQDDMDRCRLEKEKLLTRALELDKQRTSLAAKLQPSSNENDVLDLKQIISSCSEQQLRAKLEQSLKELEAAAKAVRKQNDLNSSLIHQSLGLIASTMAIMRSAPGTELPTYSHAGRLNSREEDPVFSAPRSAFTRAA